MDRTSYTNLAKAWEFVEDHAFSRQSVELNAVRTRAEETGIAQGPPLRPSYCAYWCI